MSKAYFISDLHLGHKKILDFSPSRGGDTIEEHDAWLIDRICSTVTKRDYLYILGDVCFDIQKMPMLDLIPCKKTLILGNHDKFQLDVYRKYFHKIHGFMSYKGFWLSHCPVHPKELRGRGNIHGHVHNEPINEYGYYSVCVEASNGIPRTFDEVIGVMYE